MGDFLSYLTSWEFANNYLTPFMWFVSAVSTGVCLWSLYSIRRTHRMGQWFSAQDFARLAVFDSFVRSGARSSLLCEQMEFSLRETYAATAKHKGDRFYTQFLRFETLADHDLNAAILKLGGKLTHEEDQHNTIGDSTGR